MNAVVDHGITMKNGWPVKPKAAPIWPAAPAVAVEPKFGIEVRARFQLVLDYAQYPNAPDVLLRRHSIERVIKVVCERYGITRIEFLSPRRQQRIVKPRQIAMYLAKITTPKSLPEIGQRMGNRDHTTVLHGFRKIERLRKEDADLDQEIEQLRALIEAPDPC